jgi:hypothetical protein
MMERRFKQAMQYWQNMNPKVYSYFEYATRMVESRRWTWQKAIDYVEVKGEVVIRRY